MQKHDTGSAQNYLIERLPRAERSRLLSIFEPVELAIGAILLEPGDKTRHIWFPIDGFISLISLINGSPGVEVGMVGREGVLGVR